VATVVTLARRHRARHCPWRPLRTLPCRRGPSQLERLGRREGGDSRRHSVSKENERGSDCPSKSKGREERRCSPKLENPRFLFLEGWGGTSAAPAGASVAPTGASTINPAVGASTLTPGINSTAAPSARGDGDAGSHISEVVRSPSFSSSSSDDEFAGAGGGESPCCSCSRYSSLYCSRCSRRLSFFSFTRAARSCSRRCAARPAARA
jgi:hypothetical protein